ncbi:MAG: RNA degradosome polyphosphate kinase, partial [Gemmatimonadales bacterium]
YTDLGLLTSDPDFGRDLTELFNYLTTGYKPKRKYTKLLPAPRLLKPALLKAIDREIRNHRLEQPGRIVFKMNGLEDVDVVRALYRASQAGVKVDLIVRDVCRLRPGIPGLSDNIRVVSIVGRFLEHSRIFYFHNDGAEDYWIGSADLMTRNLVSRVEVLAPVNAPELMRDLRFILEACLADNRGAWDMAPDGSYTQRDPGEDSESSCQAMLVERAEKKYKEANRLKWRRTRTAREPDPDDEL